MEFFLVAVVSLLVSPLTLYSGFGLGTVLMPVFALFFPLPLAVAATAVVHGANNALKTLLMGRSAEWSLVLRFGLPAIPSAFAGAALLSLLSGTREIATYSVKDHTPGRSSPTERGQEPSVTSRKHTAHFRL